MHPTAPPAAVGFLGLLAAGSLVMWVLVVLRLRAGEPLVPLEPRRPVPWGGVEILLIIAAYFFLGGLVSLLVLHIPVNASEPIFTPFNVLLMGAFSLVVVCIGAFVLRRLAGATWRDLGWSPHELTRDIRLGLAAGLVITAPVYAIQTLFTEWFEFPSEHPLLELVVREPTFLVYAVAIFLAVGVAPLAEEFLFRVLLQGWLEAWQSRSAAERVLTREALIELAASRADSNASAIETPALPSDRDNPYAAPPATTRGAPIDLSVELAASRLAPAWWPLVASAAIFAALHATQGPDPIALFPLALVLGYLYRQTHRLLPSLVAHAFLNSASMLLLWLNLA
ncbi:MAG: lysostaphin resistance A-like protein [Pirellulales bacterium]